MWNGKRVAEILRTDCIGQPEVPVAGCVIDSRQARDGNIFFALVGEKNDGHDYIEAAWKNGANLVIAEKDRLKDRSPMQVPVGKALILVESGLKAMEECAKTWRRELGAKVIGITGSNGKTTTKDMVAAVLAQRYRVHKNKENQNNELGVPLTVLNAPEATEMLIVEMGMRGLGQIRALCDFVEPDTGVITNIGTTHLELLGSQEKIAQAKWELIDALPLEGTAILNAEDFWSVQKAAADAHAKVFYGIQGRYQGPDVQGQNLMPSGTLGTRFEVTASSERVQAELPLPGEHNVLDALAALAVGKTYEIPLAVGCRGLAELELSKMRLELFPGIHGSQLLSDVYNANPASMQASLKILSERSQQATLAILGEMYELGDASRDGHYQVGQTVAQLGITELITVGHLAEDTARGASDAGMLPEHIHICPDRETAVRQARTLLNTLGSGTWVLIKASRGMKMEKVTEALQRSPF